MLAYRLVSYGIGGRTVRELNEGAAAREEGMDLDEFLTWAAYFSIEPPLETRADAHVALLMAQQYQLNRGKGKPPRKPIDFLPRWYTAEKDPMSIEQLESVMKRQFIALGGDLSSLEDL